MVNVLSENLERAKRRLELYYKAEEAVLLGQEYTIGSKKLRRADLADIQSMITKLEKEVRTLENGGKNRAVRAIPLDI